MIWPAGQLTVADRLAIPDRVEEHGQDLVLQPGDAGPVDGQLESAAVPGKILCQLGARAGQHLVLPLRRAFTAAVAGR
jgi:hypothetical protein